jgi:hypothetical protein
MMAMINHLRMTNPQQAQIMMMNMNQMMMNPQQMAFLQSQ